MDPNATRARMIEKANVLLGQFSVNAEVDNTDAVELAEAVHDLDEWLRSGGFFPKEWKPEVHWANRKQDVDIHTDGTSRPSGRKT